MRVSVGYCGLTQPEAARSHADMARSCAQKDYQYKNKIGSDHPQNTARLLRVSVGYCGLTQPDAARPHADMARSCMQKDYQSKNKM